MEILNGAALELRSEDYQSDRVAVTPDTATRWLATQVRNRRVQRASMRGYRTDMLQGRWKFTADPIRFDTEGHLIDGSNRLEALSGIQNPEFSVVFAVVRGLPEEAQMFMDQGARRSTGQQLGLRGVRNGTSLAAGVRMMWQWERGLLFHNSYGARLFTTPEVVGWVEKNPELCDIVGSRFTQLRHIGLSPRVGMGFGLKVGLEFQPMLNDFYGEMSELTNLEAGSPTLTFVKRVQRTQLEDERYLTELDNLGFLIRVWNAWRAAEKLTKLQRPRFGWAADNFPQLDLSPDKES